MESLKEKGPVKRALEKVSQHVEKTKGKLLDLQQASKLSKVGEGEQRQNSFLGNETGNLLEETASPKDNIVVGQVLVSDLQVRGLENYHTRYHVYVYGGVESQRRKTPRIDKLENGCASWDGLVWSFPVTDIGADVILSTYGARKVILGGDEYLGKVVIPLSRLYESEDIRNMLSTKKRSFSFEAWFMAYPLEESKIHFEMPVVGIPGTGMDKPKNGFIHIHARIQLELKEGFPLALCAAMNAPFKPIGEFEPTEFEPKHVKLGANRIKMLKHTLVGICTIATKLRHWDRPVLSALTLAWHMYVCLVAPWWQFPFLVTVLVLGLSFSFPKKRDQDLSPVVWNDEIDKDPDFPDTLQKKLKQIKKLMETIQSLLNKVAFVVERVLNATNWSDRLVALLMSLYLLCMSALASALLWCVQLFCSLIVPFHVLCFLAGVVFFLPSVSSKLLPDLLATSEGNETPEHSLELRADLETALHLIKNVFARIPDLKELMHRDIAASQEIRITS